MSDPSALTGQVVASYRLVRRIGQGGAGFVYEAIDTEEGIPVALKLFAGIIDPLGRERFMQEARLASRVSSPHLVTIYDAGEDAGKLYIAYELMADKDLDEVLEVEGTMQAAAAVDVAIQVSRGLAALHEDGIVHRDVKPANIFYRASDDRWVIGDLGVAKDTGGHSLRTGSGIMMGTPEYMAPEYTLGSGVTPATDQYSLGVVLYELLSGVHPFEGASPEELFRKQQTDVPGTEVLPEHPGLREVVLRMLAAKPEDRFPAATDLIAALEGMEGLGELPQVEPPDGDRHDGRTTRGRRRRHRSTGRTRRFARAGEGPLPAWAVGALVATTLALTWLLL